MVNLAHFIYFLIYGQTFFLFHGSLKLLWSHSIGIFSYFAVLFIWVVRCWITQKTPQAKGAAYVCEVSLKSLTLLCFK